MCQRHSHVAVRRKNETKMKHAVCHHRSNSRSRTAYKERKKQATQPSTPRLYHTYRSEIGCRLANLDGGRRVSDCAHRAGHHRSTQGGTTSGRGGREGAAEQSTPGETLKHHGAGAVVVRCVWWGGVCVGKVVCL